MPGGLYQKSGRKFGRRANYYKSSRSRVQSSQSDEKVQIRILTLPSTKAKGTNGRLMRVSAKWTGSEISDYVARQFGMQKDGAPHNWEYVG